MGTTKKILVIGCGGLAIALIATGAWWWHQTAQDQRIVSASLPRPPKSNVVPTELLARLTAANGLARSRLRSHEGLARLSRLYHANGYYDQAVQCYRILEQLEPSEPRWPHSHAAIVAGFGETATAIDLLKTVVGLGLPNRAAGLRLGDCLLKENQWDAASAAYLRCLQDWPGDPYALIGLARIDLQKGHDDDALKKLEAVVAATHYQLGYDLIVGLYEKIGATERANAIRGACKASGAYRDPPDPWLDDLIDDCYDPYRVSVAAGTLARNGDKAGALRLLQRAILLAPADVGPRFQLGTMSEENGDQATARAAFEDCTQKAPDFADAWAHLSALQLQNGDSRQAEITLMEGLRHCPRSPGLQLMRARYLKQAGRVEEAINSYLISAQLRPTEPDAFIELANTYIGLGRTEEGVAQLNFALVADPGNPVALSSLAFYAIAMDEEGEAGGLLARILRQPRVPAQDVTRLTSAYRQQFKHEWVSGRDK